MTKPANNGLEFPELTRGRLIKRYKRFLADVMLDSGKTVTAHCPNTGAMTACSAPGRPVYLSYHDNPKRKLKYTWELIDMPDSLVGVNTLIPNRLVYHSIQTGQLSRFREYTDIRAEVKIDGGHRLDLMVSKDGRDPCYIEIKNCSLVENRDGSLSRRSHRPGPQPPESASAAHGQWVSYGDVLSRQPDGRGHF